MGLPPPLRSGPREEVREGEGGGDIDRGDCLESHKWTVSNLLLSFVQFIIQGYFSTLQIPWRLLSPIQNRQECFLFYISELFAGKVHIFISPCTFAST